MMFRSYRLRKAHNRFLESCRNLKEGRAYWNTSSGFARWFFEALIPVPLIGLHENGRLLLDALHWLEDNCRRQPISEDTIKQYHRLINGTNSEGGTYRKGPITILGSRIERPRVERVGPLMKQFSLRMEEEERRLSKDGTEKREEEVLLGAATLHQRIAFIHPFRDGNGRVARLAMNHFLRRHGGDYVILPPMSESKEHFDTLGEAHRGNMEPFLSFARRNIYRL